MCRILGLVVFVSGFAVGTASAWQSTEAAPGTVSFGSGGSLREGTGMDKPPIFTLVAPGADFIQAGFTTRQGVGVACPFPLVLPALPGNAMPVASFACWNYLADDAPPNDQITINGFVVNGTRCGGGPDLCWAKLLGVSYVSRDITPFLNFGAANAIGGACDKPLGLDPAALGEGITILCVYELAGEPSRCVDVYCGYSGGDTVGVDVAEATLVFSCPYDDGDLHLFINALDGQIGAGDDVFLNGTKVSGLVNGTNATGDAWIGLLGPNPNANLYDSIDDDVGAYHPQTSTTLAIVTPIVADCIGYTFAAVAFGIECSDGTWQNYGQGWPGTLGVPGISLADIPRIGGEITLQIENSAGVTTGGFLILGFASANLPTGFGGTVLVAPSLIMGVTLPAAGRDLSSRVPGNPELCGLSAFAQCLMQDLGASNGISFTPGLEMVFGR